MLGLFVTSKLLQNTDVDIFVGITDVINKCDNSTINITNILGELTQPIWTDIVQYIAKNNTINNIIRNVKLNKQINDNKIVNCNIEVCNDKLLRMKLDTDNDIVSAA